MFVRQCVEFSSDDCNDNVLLKIRVRRHIHSWQLSTVVISSILWHWWRGMKPERPARLMEVTSWDTRLSQSWTQSPTGCQVYRSISQSKKLLIDTTKTKPHNPLALLNRLWSSSTHLGLTLFSWSPHGAIRKMGIFATHICVAGEMRAVFITHIGDTSQRN